MHVILQDIEKKNSKTDGIIWILRKKQENNQIEFYEIEHFAVISIIHKRSNSNRLQ